MSRYIEIKPDLDRVLYLREVEKLPLLIIAMRYSTYPAKVHGWIQEAKARRAEA